MHNLLSLVTSCTDNYLYMLATLSCLAILNTKWFLPFQILGKISPILQIFGMRR